MRSCCATTVTVKHAHTMDARRLSAPRATMTLTIVRSVEECFAEIAISTTSRRGSAIGSDLEPWNGLLLFWTARLEQGADPGGWGFE